MEANLPNGRPWDIASRFNTFEEADQKRGQLKQKQNLQVKVKKQKTGYVVKVRSMIVEEPKKEKVRNKSKRKNKDFYKQNFKEAK